MRVGREKALDGCCGWTDRSTPRNRSDITWEPTRSAHLHASSEIMKEAFDKQNVNSQSENMPNSPTSKGLNSTAINLLRSMNHKSCEENSVPAWLSERWNNENVWQTSCTCTALVDICMKNFAVNFWYNILSPKTSPRMKPRSKKWISTFIQCTAHEAEICEGLNSKQTCLRWTVTHVTEAQKAATILLWCRVKNSAPWRYQADYAFDIGLLSEPAPTPRSHSG